jgi:hypothetical protein
MIKYICIILYTLETPMAMTQTPNGLPLDGGGSTFEEESDTAYERAAQTALSTDMAEFDKCILDISHDHEEGTVCAYAVNNSP